MTERKYDLSDYLSKFELALSEFNDNIIEEAHRRYDAGELETYISGIDARIKGMKEFLKEVYIPESDKLISKLEECLNDLKNARKGID